MSHDLIFVSLEDWDGVWRRNQFVCAELARRHPDRRILFVAPARNVSNGLRRLDLSAASAAATEPVPGLPNVTVTRPLKLLPDSLAAGRWLNQAAARAHVAREARRLGLGPAVLWLNPHGAAHMAGRMRERAVVYDVTDDWSQLSQCRASAARTVRDDARLCRRADAVIVCSERLEELKRPLAGAGRVHLIPNGVNAEHYRRVLEDTGPLPEPADRWPRPVFGYTGTIHPDRVDVDLVEAMARRLSAGSIVLVGPSHLCGADRDRLLATGRVVLAGPAPYERVPHLMRGFDVCITPHRVTPFTESLNPIKLWEYLAAGKPVVSTPVAGFRDYPGLVRLAGDAAAFLAAAMDSLGEDPSLPAARRAEAQRHSWSGRVDAIEAVLASCTRGAAGRLAAATARRNALVPSPLYSGERVRVRGTVAAGGASDVIIKGPHGAVFGSDETRVARPLTPALSPEYRGEGAGNSPERRGEGVRNSPELWEEGARPFAPVVSAVVVSFNTRELTLRCLRALAAGQGDQPVELLVVDNASTDGSAAAVRAEFPDAVVIENADNRGFGAANNQAMALARGEFLLLINSDAFAEPGATAALVELLRGRPRVGVAGPRLLNGDGSLQASCHPFPSPGRAWLENLFVSWVFSRHRRVGDYRKWPHDAERDVDFVSGACLLVRRSAYEQVGGFDEQFFMYSEETDWQRRFRTAGWEVAFTPAARVTHLGGSSGAADRAGVNRAFFRSLDGYQVKHHGVAGLVVFRAAMVVGSVARVAMWALAWAAGVASPDRRARAAAKARKYALLTVRQAAYWPLPSLLSRGRAGT